MNKAPVCKTLPQQQQQQQQYNTLCNANSNKTIVGVIYRSPCSKAENDLKLFELINTVCLDNKNKVILVGDFNWPNIDWKSWSVPNNLGIETKFLDTLKKNFLLQHIHTEP